MMLSYNEQLRQKDNYIKNLERQFAAAEAYAARLEADIEGFDKLVYFGKERPEPTHKAALDAALEQRTIHVLEFLTKSIQGAAGSPVQWTEPMLDALGEFFEAHDAALEQAREEGRKLWPAEMEMAKRDGAAAERERWLAKLKRSADKYREMGWHAFAAMIEGIRNAEEGDDA